MQQTKESRQVGHYPTVGEAPGKKGEVRAMFDAIAPRYDLLNRLLSMGIDRTWRAAAVRALLERRPGRILDVATGTADLAIAASAIEDSRVVGVDIAEEMLEVGREKIARLGLADRISLKKGDAERLPFSDRQFDAVTVAFGVRNFEDLGRGLEEMRRVLRPGGIAVVLEFSRPARFPVKQAYDLYSRFVLPLVGRLLSRDDGAYRYLPDSIRAFPDGKAFLDHMQTAGFTDLKARRLTFGIASLYTGRAA